MSPIGILSETAQTLGLPWIPMLDVQPRVLLGMHGHSDAANDEFGGDGPRAA